MQPPEQHSWINLGELKSQIVRKLGPERSKQYFDYLNKFLSLKLSKVEFDKLCLRTIGRDGIALHNQLIRLILRNACTEKVPVGNKKPSDGVYHQNGSGQIVTHASSQLGLPNGDLLPTSPRKARTGARERKGGDRKSALGPNGKTVYSSPSSSIPDDLTNGNLASPDTRRHTHHHQETIPQAQIADGQAESSGQQEGKGVSNRIPLHAPLGIPYYPVSIGGSRKLRDPPIGVADTNSLLDTIALRARMEPIVATQGLQGASLDSANALNIGLGAYLKGIIRCCAELNKSTRTGPDHFSPVNSVIHGHHYQPQQHEPVRPISLLDLRVAMELNPQLLGEDWPVLLERICTHAFRE